MLFTNSFRRISKKIARTAIICSSKSDSDSIIDFLRNSNFQEIDSFTDLDSFLKSHLQKAYDWLISGIFLKNEINLLELLNASKSSPTLANLVVTPFLESEEDKKQYELLLELGAYAALEKKDLENREHLQTYLIDVNPDEPIAGLTKSILRRKEFPSPKQKLRILDAALKRLPFMGHLYFNYGLLLIELKRPEEALPAFRVAANLAPTLLEHIKKVFQKYYPNENLNSAARFKSNSFRITGITVVGFENKQIKIMAEAFKGLGTSILAYTSPIKALSDLEQQQCPNLLIIDYDQKEMHPCVFLQKLNSMGHLKDQVVVFYSKIDQSDENFLRELGIAKVIKKDCLEEGFLQSLSHSFQNSIYSPETFLQNNLRKIAKSFASRKPELAVKELFRSKCFASGSNQATHLLIKAELLYQQEKLDEALTQALKALEQGSDPIISLSIIGKILTGMRKFEQAFFTFSHAQELSPLKIDRLCNLAKIKITVGDTEAATDLLSEAKSFESNDKTILEIESEISIMQKDIKTARTNLERLKSLESFITFINNKSTQLTTEGKVAQGIEILKNALEAIPERHAKLRPMIEFNLAMGLLRNGRTDEAITHFENCEKSADQRVVEKASRVKSTLLEAKSNGAKINIATPTQPGYTSKNRATLQKIKQSIEQGNPLSFVKAGDHLLYSLFTSETSDEEKSDLIKNSIQVPQAAVPW